MTYRDLDKVISKLEERDDAIGRALDVVTSSVDSVAEDLGFMEKAIGAFDDRQSACKKVA